MTTIRAYEKSDAPIEERLASLARRFPCLENADGLNPWSETKLSTWVLQKSTDSSEYHAGLFLLNLAGRKGCEKFDVLEAVKIWDESDLQVFINWMRVWKL